MMIVERQATLRYCAPDGQEKPSDHPRSSFTPLLLDLDGVKQSIRATDDYIQNRHPDAQVPRSCACGFLSRSRTARPPACTAIPCLRFRPRGPITSVSSSGPLPPSSREILDRGDCMARPVGQFDCVSILVKSTAHRFQLAQPSRFWTGSPKAGSKSRVVTLAQYKVCCPSDRAAVAALSNFVRPPNWGSKKKPMLGRFGISCAEAQPL